MKRNNDLFKNAKRSIKDKIKRIAEMTTAIVESISETIESPAIQVESTTPEILLQVERNGVRFTFFVTDSELRILRLKPEINDSDKSDCLRKRIDLNSDIKSQIKRFIEENS